jgi:hypothetical protein
MTSTDYDATEKHNELIEHGWRVDLHGGWQSPKPRRRFSHLDAAWRAHLDHLDQQPPPTSRMINSRSRSAANTSADSQAKISFPRDASAFFWDDGDYG